MSDPTPTNAFLPAIEQIDRHHALKVLALCSSPRAAPDSTRTILPGPWKHVAELEYVGPNHPSIATWNDYSIITYLVRAAITIPPRSDSRSDPWVMISSNDGSGNTTLPRGYRIPLLWLAKVQWESLKLLLTVAKPLWDLIKYDILHLARLTTQFLSKARSEPRMKRQWRDPMFDRTLTRFFNGWMGCSEMFIWDFYREFKDEEYKDDLLARRWAQKVPKGIRGFVITEQELLEGISTEQFTSGLVVDRANETFEWKVEPEVELPPPTPQLPSPARRKEDEKAAATNSRGSSPLTSDLGSDLEMVAESSNPQASASEPPTPAPTESVSTHRPPPPPPIQTGSELPRKKSHKTKSRSKADRQDKDKDKDKASRPIRTRTMSSSISGLSPATPKVAHLSRSDMSLPGSSASSPNRTPFGFDFTAPVESRGRKRKIESVYSGSPLTSDSEDDSSGRGSNRHNSRPAQSAAPDGRAFAINSRIVIPRLTNPEVYSKPTTEAYSMTPIEQHPSVAPKTPRKGSTSEAPSPRKAPKTPASPSQHYKLYAISSSPSTNPFDPTNPSTSIPPFHNWRHVEELPYIGPSHPSAAEWTDIRIVTYMLDNAFSIPSRNADSKQTWVEVKVGDVITVLPRGYRIPLLWLGRVQWDCLKLLLTTGKDQWPTLKFDVLHLARLSAEFFAKARKEVKMKRQYRNVMFDRALSRFFNGWMGSRDEFVWDFYREFRDEEYEDDMLQRRWLQKTVKGIQGFALTEHELNEGITVEQFTQGLTVDRERGTFEWIDPDTSAPATASPPSDPAIEAPQSTIETTSQSTSTIEAATQSSHGVEGAAPTRRHSPLSLSQVAGDRSASSSPLTPVIGLDHAMDVDPPAQAAAAAVPSEQLGKTKDAEPSFAPAPSVTPIVSKRPTPLEIAAVGRLDRVDDGPPPPHRWTSPLRSATPPAVSDIHGDGAGAEDVNMDVAEGANPVGTPLASLDLDQQVFNGDGNTDDNLDDMNALDELEADFIRYPPSIAGTPPPKPDSAIPNSFLLGPQPAANGSLSSTIPLIQPQPQATVDEDEPELEFDETDYIRSRLPSPFAATPPPQAPQLEALKPGAMFPLAEPPVELVSSPRAASPQSESIRSSSSPEQRTHDLPQHDPQSRGSAPPEAEAATDQRLPSLPPDSDEEVPAQEPAEVEEPAQDEHLAHEPVKVNGNSVQPSEGPTERGATSETVATEALAEVEVAHILPLSPADAMDEFPPGFHFMGMLHGTQSHSNISQTLFSQPSRDVAPAAPSQTQLAAQNNGAENSSNDVPVRSTAEASRASMSPPIFDRAQSPLVDAPFTTRLSPATITAETVLSTLPKTDDSKRVKLEIMTVSLSNGGDGVIAVEDEEDMDIETPVDVDMADRSVSPPAVAPSRIASPPLSDSQSLFTPDATPRSANTSAAVIGTIARIAAAAGGSPLASPSIRAPPSVSQQSTDDMVAPGLSTIGRPSFGTHDVNVFGREPAASQQTPSSSSLPPQGVVGKPSAPPAQNMSGLNGARNSPTAMGRPSLGQNMSGLNGTRESPSALGKPSGPPAHNSLNGARDSLAGFFPNGSGGSRPFLRDKPSVHPLPQRPDVRVDGGGIRIPDTNEYDPRQRDPIILGPSTSFSMPSMQRGGPPRIQPGVPPNMQPNMQPGRPPIMQAGMHPNMQPGMQPNIQPGMQPNMQPNMQPGMQPNMQPGMQPNMQPGMQPNMQPGMQPNMQPNMHSGVLSGPGMQPAPPYHQRWIGYSGPPAPGGYHPPYSPLVSLNHPPPQNISPSPSLHGPPQIHPRSPSVHAPPQTLPMPPMPPRAPSVQPPPMPPRAPSVQPLPMPPSVPPPPRPSSVQPSPTNGRPIPQPPPARVNHTPDIEIPKAQNTVIPIPIPVMTPARPPSSSAHDSVRSPLPQAPSPAVIPSPAVVPSATVDRILPVVEKAPESAPLAVDDIPEVEMEIEDSPRRSSSPSAPANDAPAQSLSNPSSSAAPAPIAVDAPLPRVPELDMRSLENALVMRLKQEMRSQLKDELKGELKDELRGELKGEMRGEMRGELKGELRGELKSELRTELKSELEGEFKGELRNELKSKLESELKDELRDQLMSQLRGELKRELQGELKRELKGDLRGELKDGLKDEVKGELLVQIRDEIPGRMKQELLRQLRDDLFVQLKDDLLLQLKDDLLIQLKAQLLTQLKAELLLQLKDDLLLSLKDELLRQLQTELLILLKDDLKAQLTDDLTTSLKTILKEQLRAELKDEMIHTLKEHFTEQLKNQLKVLLVQLKDAVNSQLRDDLIIQLKYFIAKLKEELIVQLKDTLTVHLKDGLITQVKAALTAQLRDGLGAQREQLNLDFERRRLFLEQQPRMKAVKPPASPAVSTPTRPTPTTPRPHSSVLFQARHPLHHLVLESAPDPASMDVDAPASAPTPTPSAPTPTSTPAPNPLPPSLPTSPSKAKGNETPLPLKSQRKQSWFATGYQASPQTSETS